MDVSSRFPLSVPLVPSVFVTVRSNATGPRTPLTGLLWSCAIVAGDRRPSNVPVMASLLPVSTADTVPDPAIVACIDTSIGTGDSRVLKVLGCCPTTRTAEHRITSHVVCRIDASPRWRQSYLDRV